MQRRTTKANSIHKRETVAQNHPVFLHSGMDFSSCLRNNDGERETATSQNHKRSTCPFLTLRHLADYKDTVNGVILTQQREGGKEESTRVPGQGARLSCRSTSHLPWLMGFSGCRSRRARGGRIWG